MRERRLTAAIFAAVVISVAAVPDAAGAPRNLPSTGDPPHPTPSACVSGDALTPHRTYDAYARTLVDWTYMLPPDYVPLDLVSVDGTLVRDIVLPDLARLREAAAAAGARLSIVSAYRSFAQQRATFDYWVSVGGFEAALQTSARAGHSEHQLGTTIDFGTAGGSAPWEYRDWGETREGAWLAAHAHEYGFVLSYPAGKRSVTCYAYEPWHFRWLGPAAAASVVSSGLTLREYLLDAR